jgi:hypothetical protein
MAGILLQLQQSPSFHYLLRDALEPIAGPLTVIVIVSLIVFAIRRRIRFNRNLYNALTRPTIIYQQIAPPAATAPPEDYSTLTKEDFYNLPSEVREAMYKKRIHQLNDTIQRLKARLKEAELPTD